MIKRIIIHPFLFAAFPVFFIYAYNVNRVSFSETVLPLFIMELITLTLLGVWWWYVREIQKSALLVSVFLILFFSYGHIFFDLSLRGVQQVFFSIIWLVLFFLATFFIVVLSLDFSQVTRVLNFVSIILIAMSFITVGYYQIRNNTIATLGHNENSDKIFLPHNESRSREKLPDIYYLILDRYAQSDVLKEYFDYDNKDFLEFLQSKKFYLAQASKANYLSSAHSLASSLNMEYINYLADSTGKNSRNYAPLYSMLQNNRVQRYLQSFGYTYYHFGSWWEPTSKNKYADYNINIYTFSEFTTILLKTTWLSTTGIFDFRKEQYQRIPYQFKKLKEISKIDKPTFVFAHFLIPHGPYVFEKDGSYVPEDLEQSRSLKENYLHQLDFTNTLLKDFLNTALSNSKNFPIIILQADEGPYPVRYESNINTFQWKQATEQEKEMKMKIFNAYFFPGVDADVLYPTISPVNTFRAVFKLYFKSEVKLLPDEVYYYTDYFHPYDFFQ